MDSWWTRLTLGLAVALIGGLVPALAVSSTSAAAASDPPGCPAGYVVLTFDDGPSPAVTPALVETLQDLGVPATFFPTARKVARHPDTAALAREAGFQFANHAWTHPRLPRLSARAVGRQLGSAQRLLEAQGYAPLRLMRPTQGVLDRRTRRLVRRLGYGVVFWNIDSRDFRPQPPARIADRVLSGLRPHRANVVVLHDGRRHSARTVAAVPRIVETARSRGFCFATFTADGRVPVSAAPPRSVPAPSHPGRRGR